MFVGGRPGNPRRLLAAAGLWLAWPLSVAHAQVAVTPVPAGSTEAAPTPTPSPPGAADAVQEVTVRGVREPPGGQEMTSRDVKQMPGSFGDAFRAIEALPGVTPLVSGVPYFLVRGAPPGNTGFFVDGVRVPALFHLGVGAAVVHPSLIDRVDFYPGGYPARFGRFTGGILSGEIARLPDTPHAEASIRLIDAGGLVSTPFADGRGDVVASGRYGYPGPMISLFDPDVSLSYWDYQTRVQWRFDDRDQISVFAFGSYDSLSSRNTNTGRFEELLGIQFHRVDLRWDRRTSATGRLRVALTLGYDRTAGGSGSSSSNENPNSPSSLAGPSKVTTTNTEDSIESESIGLRAEWSDELSPALEARVGSDVLVAPYRVNLSLPGGTGLGGSGPGQSDSVFGTTSNAFTQIDVNGGAYGELVWRPSSGVELRPGLRADVFTSRFPTNTSLVGNDSGSARAVGALDPRLSARWDTTSWLAWIASLGVAHQASNIPLPSPGLQFSQLSRGLQSAFQYTAGAELKLPLKFTATVDAFLQDYTGIADIYESCPSGQTSCTFDGRAIGMELLVRRRLTERWTGWLSYTLSRTERDAFYQTLTQSQWIRTLSGFDRTHVVNVVLAADLGKRWRAGGRVVAYSGLPYSTTTGIVGIPNAREPPFVRLDLRLEKKWQALGGTMTLVFEWLNALLSKESFGTNCTGGAPAQCQPMEIGPITVPSVGLEASW
jgi:hypothetical protein